MTGQPENGNIAASLGPHGFITERFPGRGGIDWSRYGYLGTEPPPPDVKPPRGEGAASAYGYDFGSGFLSRHWAELRQAMRRR